MPDNVLPELRDQLTAAAAHEAQATPSRRRSPRRTLAVVFAGVAVTAATAAAAATLLTGRDAPPRHSPQSIGLGAITPGTTKLLAVTAPDPDGGPAWGMRVFSTKAGFGCVQTGRRAGSAIGALGQDGAFGDDQRFHRLPLEADGCASLVAGQPVLAATLTRPASAYSDSCETPQDQAGRQAAPAALRKLITRLKPGAQRDQAQRDLRRALARSQRHAPACDLTHLRTLAVGMAGHHARSVTVVAGTQRVTKAVRPQDGGAYLVVLRTQSPVNRSQTGLPVHVSVRYDDGTVCPRDGARRCAKASGRTPSPKP